MKKIKTKEETKKQDRYVYIDIARVFAYIMRDIVSFCGKCI